LTELQDEFPASRIELHVEWLPPLLMKKTAPMAPISTPKITQVDRIISVSVRKAWSLTLES